MCVKLPKSCVNFIFLCKFDKEPRCFLEKFTQLGKILHDRRSRRSRQISSLTRSHRLLATPATTAMPCGKRRSSFGSTRRRRRSGSTMKTMSSSMSAFATSPNGGTSSISASRTSTLRSQCRRMLRRRASVRWRPRTCRWRSSWRTST